MENFFARFDKYMKFKDLNDNKVTVQAGLGIGIIGKARKRGALSQENIEKLLLYYSDLNANWLFRGDGEMLTMQSNCDINSELTQRIFALQDLIEYQREEIKNLRNVIAEHKKSL